MGKVKNILGKRFARLTVVERVKKKGRNAHWLCECDCGNTIITITNRLTTGNTKSCGCLQRDLASSRKENLLGQRFGRLIVSGESDNHTGRTAWACTCDCGTVKTVTAKHLKEGRIVSCGCLRKDKGYKGGTYKHGQSKTFEYRVWSGMHSRCYNKKASHYKDYGGRGIVICGRWRDSFDNFITDMGKAPSNKHSIERIKNHKNYTPTNCKWATAIEQARNKRNNVMVTYNGTTKSLAAWAQSIGCKTNTLYARLGRLQWSTEKALTTPVRSSSKRNVSV